LPPAINAALDNTHLQPIRAEACEAIYAIGMTMDVRDSNGAILQEGDNVTLVKDLKVKGTSETLKRGTMIKGIHLTDNPDEVECRHAKIKGLVLRTEFLKKA
jgi:protein PhnA